MSADVDLDFGNRKDILDVIKHIPAIRETKTKRVRHNSGVYVQPLPVDPITGYSNILFKDADDRGYFKLDFLNVALYKRIKNPEHYERLLATEPQWDRFGDREFVTKISHISNYCTEIAYAMPDTIPRLAMFIAAIRPAKKHLLGRAWSDIAETIWDAPEDGSYSFKQSHAVAYAMLITLHMNIIVEEEKQALLDFADKGN